MPVIVSICTIISVILSIIFLLLTTLTYQTGVRLSTWLLGEYSNYFFPIIFFLSAHPKITDTSSGSVTILVGYPLNLTCVVIGDPKPIISWNKFGVQEISPAVYDRGNSTLIIHQVSIADEGVYQCAAWSAAGIVATNFTVLVHGLYCPSAFTYFKLSVKNNIKMIKQH